MTTARLEYTRPELLIKRCRECGHELQQERDHRICQQCYSFRRAYDHVCERRTYLYPPDYR